MAMAAGTATLEALSDASYERLEERGAALAAGLEDAARKAGVPVQVNRVGSMLTVYFSGEPVFDAASARKADAKAFGRFFHAMLERGVYLAPSQFEACFLSVAHTDEDVQDTIRAAEVAFAASRG
jgi:glutamate-1-semialdehyde 2,1-aminomutase